MYAILFSGLRQTNETRENQPAPDSMIKRNSIRNKDGCLLDCSAVDRSENQNFCQSGMLVFHTEWGGYPMFMLGYGNL
jgi:hypothetical protein